MKISNLKFQISKNIQSANGKNGTYAELVARMDRALHRTFYGVGVMFANEEAAAQCAAEMVTFHNELNVDAEGWAQLAVYGDFPGEGVVRHANGKIDRFEAIQRVDKQSAEDMAKRFKTPWGRLKRYIKGCTIYNGHPDMPGAKNADMTSCGTVADLEARADGLYCLPVFSNAGEQLLEGKQKLFFSGEWTSNEIAGENGKRVFRPDRLVSVGLTPRPNLPVKFLNQKSTTDNTDGTDGSDGKNVSNENQNTKTKGMIMEKSKIVGVLSKHGIVFANAAAPTDAEIEAGLIKLGELAGNATTFGNERDVARAELATAKAAVTSKDAEIATLTTRATVAETSFANEKKAKVDAVIDLAKSGGRITEAQAVEWRGKLETSFANSCAEIGKLPVIVKVAGVTDGMGDRKARFANANDRIRQVQELVKAQQTKGLSYDEAFAAVKRENPALFAEMVTTTGKA